MQLFCNMYALRLRWEAFDCDVIINTVESRYYVVNFSTQKKRNTGANAINVCLCFQSIKIVKLLILNVEGRVLIISY